ncbi:hypothetical protein GCM10027091_68020 [Streptomyces daliensis]
MSANTGKTAPTRLGEGGPAHGAAPGQIASARVRRRAALRGLPVIPVPGTRKRSRVEENVEENTAATRIVLTEDDEPVLLEPIAARVAGPRYAEMSFSSAGRE